MPGPQLGRAASRVRPARSYPRAARRTGVPPSLARTVPLGSTPIRKVRRIASTACPDASQTPAAPNATNAGRAPTRLGPGPRPARAASPARLPSTGATEATADAAICCTSHVFDSVCSQSDWGECVSRFKRECRHWRRQHGGLRQVLAWPVWDSRRRRQPVVLPGVRGRVLPGNTPTVLSLC